MIKRFRCKISRMQSQQAIHCEFLNFMSNKSGEKTKMITTKTMFLSSFSNKKCTHALNVIVEYSYIATCQ